MKTAVLVLLVVGLSMAIAARTGGGYHKYVVKGNRANQANENLPKSAFETGAVNLEKVVNELNRPRSEAAMVPDDDGKVAINIKALRWSSGLAAMAQGIADTCIVGQAQPFPMHEEAVEILRQVGKSYIGQNQFFSTRRDATKRDEDSPEHIMDAVAEWKEAKDEYPNNCGVDDCDLYIQMVYAMTEFVGCGLQICNKLRQNGVVLKRKAVFLVCNYAQAFERNEDVFTNGNVPPVSCGSTCPSGFEVCDRTTDGAGLSDGLCRRPCNCDILYTEGKCNATICGQEGTKTPRRKCEVTPLPGGKCTMEDKRGKPETCTKECLCTMSKPVPTRGATCVGPCGRTDGEMLAKAKFSNSTNCPANKRGKTRTVTIKCRTPDCDFCEGHECIEVKRECEGRCGVRGDLVISRKCPMLRGKPCDRERIRQSDSCTKTCGECGCKGQPWVCLGDCEGGEKERYQVRVCRDDQGQECDRQTRIRECLPSSCTGGAESSDWKCGAACGSSAPGSLTRYGCTTNIAGRRVCTRTTNTRPISCLSLPCSGSSPCMRACENTMSSGFYSLVDRPNQAITRTACFRPVDNICWAQTVINGNTVYYVRKAS